MGELEQHKEMGKPKTQTCRGESSPWEVLHVVNVMVNGLEWGTGVTNVRPPPVEQERMATLANLIRKMSYNLGKMLEHPAPGPALV